MFELNTLLSLVCLGFSGLLACIGLMDLGRPCHWAQTDRWRDPAPMLFRLLLPSARFFAQIVTLPEHRRHPLQRKLDRAGIGYAILAGELSVLRLLTALTVSTLGLLLSAAMGRDIQEILLFLIAGLALGFIYPDIWLTDHGRRREQRIARQFPALLELLGLAVRAGLGFGAALAQSTAQLNAGPLDDEFQRVAREIRTGLSRREALERLAQRTDLAAIHSFVAAIIQADETGAAVSHALNDQATQRRRERFAIAEKKANEAPVKMLLPLVGLLFPVAFLIIGFPIAMQFMDGGLL